MKSKVLCGLYCKQLCPVSIYLACLKKEFVGFSIIDDSDMGLNTVGSFVASDIYISL